MKIIQIIANISGGGLAKYVCELNKGLRKNGVDVKVWKFLHGKEYNSDNEIDFGDVIIEDKEINDETVAELNSCDYVFVNSIPIKRHPEDFKRDYINMIKNLKTKTIFFNNAHRWRSVTSNYGDIVLDKDLMMSFHKIVCHSPNCEFFNKMKETFGDNVVSKYAHLQIPYEFDESKSLWKDCCEKYKRVTYFGRPVGIKDPGRIIAMQPTLVSNGFTAEMRGVSRGIGIVGIPNLVYKFVDGKQTQDKSELTLFISNKWKVQQGLDKDDSLVHYTNRQNKIFVFGPYNINEGMDAISYSMFACDFYNLPNHQYGDNLEYALYDIINAGTIPMCDTDMGKNVYANENGVPTPDTLLSLNCGIFIDHDLTNLSNVIAQMKEVTSSDDNYNVFRNKIFDIYKKHADPKSVAAQLLKEIN